MVSGGLRWFVKVYSGLSYSHTRQDNVVNLTRPTSLIYRGQHQRTATQSLALSYSHCSNSILSWPSKQINFGNLGLLNCTDVHFCYTVRVVVVYMLFFIHVYRTIAVQPFHVLNVCMCLFVVAITIATAWRS